MSSTTVTGGGNFRRMASMEYLVGKASPSQTNAVPLDQIKVILESAFDEGAESPYSLKDQIVNNLYNSVVKNAEPNTQRKQVDLNATAKMVSKTLPMIVKNILASVPTFALCGGSILRHMISPNFGWKSSDYDIFGYYKDIEDIKLNNKWQRIDKQRYNTYGELGIEQNISYTKKIVLKTPDEKDYIINLIALDKKLATEQIIEKFDLQMCQIAFVWNNGNPNLIASPKTIDDILARRINLSDYQKLRLSGNLNLTDRIKKYIKRGFHDQTKLVQQEAISYSI